MGNKNQEGTGGQGSINQAKINIIEAEQRRTQFPKPITFEEFGPTEESKNPQKKRAVTWVQGKPQSNLLSVYASGGSAMKSARSIEDQLDRDHLTIINEKGDSYSNNGDKNDVIIPFSVVKRTIDAQVLQTIKSLKNEFLSKYDHKIKGNEDSWKINGKGFYFKDLPKSRIIIVKPDLVYEGGFVKKQLDVLPHENGTLFTAKGMYVGHFSQGEAHGKGAYTDRVQKNRFQGKWTNGELTSGAIDNPHYHFQGSFYRSLAQGQGSIYFSKQKCTYTGGFHQGLYQDQNGYFQSNEYDYSGCFKEGKKDGIGCLIQKEKYFRIKNKRYKPQQEFQGYFQSDHYKGKKKVSEEALQK